MSNYIVLVINPGSTSTKVAVFENQDKIFYKTIKHSVENLSMFEKITDQYEFRRDIIEQQLKDNNIDLKSLKAVVGIGGLTRPVESGTYIVNNKMLEDLADKSIWGMSHASALGAYIAKSIGDELNIPAFIVDPISVNEFDDIARISGVPEIERKCLSHALNIKAVGRALAKELGKKFNECNFIAAHLGGGITISPLRKGRIVDANNAMLGMGPFSPQRAGALPIGGVIDLCFSGKYTKEELERKFIKKSGFIAYLDTDDGVKIAREIEKGNEKFITIVQAMAYQIAKEVGACATVLKGKVDAIYYTGGLANDKYLMKWVKERTEFIAPIYIYPGEKEMEALAQGAIRVLKGEEKAREYK